MLATVGVDPDLLRDDGVRAPRHGRGAGGDRRRDEPRRARAGPPPTPRPPGRASSGPGRSWSGTSPTRRPSSSRSCQPHLETPEWKAVEKKLRQAAAGRGRPVLRLAHRRDERATHRAFLQQTVPTPVVTVLSQVFGRRYNREIAPVWRAGQRLRRSVRVERSRSRAAARSAPRMPPRRRASVAARNSRTPGSWCPAAAGRRRGAPRAARGPWRRTRGGCRRSRRGRRPARAPRRSPSPRCRGPRSPRGGR